MAASFAIATSPEAWPSAGPAATPSTAPPATRASPPFMPRERNSPRLVVVVIPRTSALSFCRSGVGYGGGREADHGSGGIPNVRGVRATDP